MTHAHEFSKLYPGKIVLVASGAFLNAYDDDARVLSQALGYSLINSGSEHVKCGCSLRNKQKLCERLEDLQLSYVEVLTRKEDNEYRVGCAYDADKNNYSNYLKQGASISVKESKHTIKNSKKGSEFDALTFISDLCEGIDPFTGQCCNSLDLEDPRVIRSLYKIRETLCSLANSKEH